MTKHVYKSEGIYCPEYGKDQTYIIQYEVNDHVEVKKDDLLLKLVDQNGYVQEVKAPIDGIFISMCKDGIRVKPNLLIGCVKYEISESVDRKPIPEDFGLDSQKMGYLAYFTPNDPEKKLEKNIQQIHGLILDTKKLISDNNQKKPISEVLLSLMAISFISGIFFSIGYVFFSVIEPKAVKQPVFTWSLYGCMWIFVWFLYDKHDRENKKNRLEKIYKNLENVTGNSTVEKLSSLEKKYEALKKLNAYMNALEEYKTTRAETGEAWWRKLSSYELENAVSRMFNKRGYKSHVTKKSGDGGIDVIVRMENKTLLIQCKGWEAKVGVKPIRELAGVVSHYISEQEVVGVILGTNGFTEEAIKFSKQSNIFLWDSKILSQIANGSYEI